jgi:hypothetical protein
VIVRFDDSLPTLVRTLVEELGEPALTSGIALRDASGRLAFFISTEPDEATVDRVSARLREVLGAYARTDRVFAGSNDFGVQELLKDPSVLNVNVDTVTVRLLDRRLVGVDWLRPPAPVSAPPVRFVFASLKGGVGRSTALSVAAADFASRGRRVLAVDLDMEAPGIGSILLDEGTLPEFGLIDALVENGLSPLDEEFFADLVGPSILADRRGRIDVIPAFGLRSMHNPGDVLAKIARAYAEDIRPDGSVATILDQVSDIVAHFSDPKRYDVILIDARAGLHETAASAILGLGAEVLLFGLDDPQTFHGYSALLAHMSHFIDPAGLLPEWLQRLTMVQGKAPRDAKARGDFIEKCRELFVAAGLNGQQSVKSIETPVPADPFSNVPWLEDDEVDEAATIEENAVSGDTLAILDDNQFRQFQPLERPDLISRSLYDASFGTFLNWLNRAVQAESGPDAL